MYPNQVTRIVIMGLLVATIAIGVMKVIDLNDTTTEKCHRESRDTPGQYPYFNENDWKNIESEDTCDNDLAILHKYKKTEVERRLYKMSLSANREIGRSSKTDDLRLVMIGKTGQGKSSTANTLLNYMSKFEAGDGHKSVTKASKLENAVVFGRKINVFDTPGLQDTDTRKIKTLEEMLWIFSYYDEGVHAFLYIINLADPRFTKEDLKFLQILEETFGGDFLNYCILVFTHGNDLKSDLDAFCTRLLAIGEDKEKTANQEQEQHFRDKNGFVDLINAVAWRVVAIDNHQCSPFEADRHRRVIFSMVDKMREENDPSVYTHRSFERAQEEKEKRRREGLKKGWRREDMESVDEFIARYPDITEEELLEKVNEHRGEKLRLSREQVYEMKDESRGYATSLMWGIVTDHVTDVGSKVVNGLLDFFF